MLSFKTVTLLLFVDFKLALFEILTVLFEFGPVVSSDAESSGTVSDPVPKLLDELDTVTFVFPVFELPTLPDPELPLTEVLLWAETSPELALCRFRLPAPTLLLFVWVLSSELVKLTWLADDGPVLLTVTVLAAAKPARLIVAIPIAAYLNTDAFIWNSPFVSVMFGLVPGPKARCPGG
jgi:hypothetical protein